MAAAGFEARLSARPSAPRDIGLQVPSAGPLVGRPGELGRLDETLELVAGGRTMGVLIAGDAGVGKSRIIDEFCDHARLRGANVATGLCLPADNAVPYAPVMGILRDIGRILGRTPKAATLLEVMGGYIALDEPAADPAATPDRGRQAPPGPFAKTVFFEAVLHDVTALAERSPVLMVVEDLHWTDSASSELLDYLVRNLGDARVMTVGSYREEEIDRAHPLAAWLSEILRHPDVRRIAVEPLGRDELTSLVTNTLGRPANPALLDSVWTRSQGNPFFAEQLLADGDPAVLPNALMAVIEHRVRQLPESAQRLLEVLATAGAGAPHELLEVVGGLESHALESCLAAAIDKKILVVDEAGSGYRFRHALLREAVYERLLQPQKRRLHHAIAEALTENPALTAGGRGPGPGVSELASHWWAAGEWARALPTSLQAADAAIAALAFPEAFAFLERALSAETKAGNARGDGGVTRAQLLEKAADIAYLAGANERAAALAEEAVSALDPEREPLAAARCLTLLGRNLWGVGDSSAAFEAYEKALQLLPGNQPSLERARLLAEQARGHMLLAQYRLGAVRAQEALEAARAIGSRQVEGHALNTLGVCSSELRGYQAAMPLIRQSLEIAEELALPEDLNRAFANLSQTMIDAGHLDEAASLMFDCAALGEDLWGCRLNGATGNGVEAMVRLGRYPDAERLLALLGSQALGVCAPAPWILPSPMRIRRGEFATAESDITYAIELTSRFGDVQHAATAQALRGELELERGRPGEAAAALDAARALAARSEDGTLLPELCMWTARAIVDEHQSVRNCADALADARERAAQLLATAQGVVDSREQRGATPTPRQRAAVAQTAAEKSRLERSDADLWDRAARLWEDAHEVYPQAYCRWREAEAVLESRGARARAAAGLDAAHAIAQRLQARPMLGRISQLARRGRLELSEESGKEPIAAQVAADALGLTPREIEVLGFLADGSTDREIAETLFISKKTVSVHVSNVLRKLSVSRRFEAARIGQDHGLGTAPRSISAPSNQYE